ncbi:hypothetical protein [Streptomyces sp. enrichment culture]|uniref:hypothetical protein n=1 Tax=Streptomyces sp. enrichment culture TaxID=1795815 RepID=UPI003F55BADF
MTTDACGEFLAAVDQLRDDGGTVRLTAHTSSVSADAWSAPTPAASGAESAPATPEADSAS